QNQRLHHVVEHVREADRTENRGNRAHLAAAGGTCQRRHVGRGTHVGPPESKSRLGHRGAYTIQSASSARIYHRANLSRARATAVGMAQIPVGCSSHHPFNVGNTASRCATRESITTKMPPATLSPSAIATPPTSPCRRTVTNEGSCCTRPPAWSPSSPASAAG